MGQTGSITAKAQIHDLLRVFTQWNESRIQEMLLRARKDFSDTFALRFGEFEHLLNRELVSFLLARDMFNEIFDTDNNNMVDKYEVLCLAIMMSTISTQKKVEFLFDLFDFNDKGFLTKAEMSLAFITVVNSLHKGDGRRAKPTPLLLNSILENLFEVYSRGEKKDSVFRYDFLSFCANTSDVRGYLEFWRGVASQVLLPSYLKWRDPWFPASEQSVAPNPEWLDRGMPPSDFIQWRRSQHVGTGFTRLFTHKTTQLKNHHKTLTFHGPGVIGTGTLKQGLLASRWLLNAFAAIIAQPASIPELFSHTGQEQEGRFCCRLYEGGGWRTIFVDDRIPCKPDGTVAFSSSSDTSEFWVTLLEKAVAKYMKTYADFSICGLRSDSPEIALRWCTGGHVMKLCTYDFDWKSLSSECEGTDGVGYIQTILSEGSIVLCGRSETNVIDRNSMSKNPYQGPPHGRLFPVVGTLIREGYRYIVLRDAWGCESRAKTKAPPDEEFGHSRLFEVKSEDVTDLYDTLVVCRYLDALKDSTEKLGFRPWRTENIKVETGGVLNPATLKITIPDDANRDHEEDEVVRKRVRSTFGEEKSIRRIHEEERKKAEREERRALLQSIKHTKPVEIVVTCASLQDWSEVGLPRVITREIKNSEGKVIKEEKELQPPSIRLKFVPTPATVDKVRAALRSERERDYRMAEEERIKKAEKLKELIEGKDASRSTPSATVKSEAHTTGDKQVAAESKFDSKSVATDSKSTASSMSRNESKSLMLTSKDLDSKIEEESESLATKSTASIDGNLGDNSLMTAIDADTNADGKANINENSSTTSIKNGENDDKDTEVNVQTTDVPTTSVIPTEEKNFEREFRAGVDSRDGVRIIRDGGWIAKDEDGVDDPTPIVEIGLERSWVSHSIFLYPGEYALYTHVTYPPLEKGWDLKFDRSGELGERPWLESEMTTDEITGKSDGVDAPRHKRMWLQVSSVYPFTADHIPSLETIEEIDEDFNKKTTYVICPRPVDFDGTVESINIAKEKWPFMAEAQSEVATRDLTRYMGELHEELKAFYALMDQAKLTVKEVKQENAGIKIKRSSTVI